MSGPSPVGGAGESVGRFLLLGTLLAPPFRGPMLVVGAALALSSALDIPANLPLLCGGGADLLPVTATLAVARFLLATTPLPLLALAWLAMLLAMMTPLVALPLSHVRASSLVARRGRAAAAFLLGYFGVWMFAGIPLLAAALLLRVVAGSILAAFLAASLVAVVWSASPLQQAAQNRAHRLRRIGLFGLAADRDCLAFGAGLGGWCLASCWAWMLVSLSVPAAHVPAMAAVAAIVMAERLRGPGAERWRTPVVLSPLFAVLRGLWIRAARAHV